MRPKACLISAQGKALGFWHQKAYQALKVRFIVRWAGRSSHENLPVLLYEIRAFVAEIVACQLIDSVVHRLQGRIFRIRLEFAKPRQVRTGAELGTPRCKHRVYTYATSSQRKNWAMRAARSPRTPEEMAPPAFAPVI